jgi:hypothetical protein
MFPEALLTSSRNGELTVNDLSKVADSLAIAGRAAAKIPAQKTAPSKIWQCCLFIGGMGACWAGPPVSRYAVRA